MASSLSVKNRARSIAHRWGPITVIDKSGPELAALAIRYDEEDHDTAETFLLRVGPGRGDAVDGMLGTAVGVACSSSGTLFVLDHRGTVHAGGHRHRLAGGRAIVAHREGVVVAGDQKLWHFDADGTNAAPGPDVRARLLCSSARGLLAALDDGSLALIDGDTITPVRAPDLKATAKASVAALHMDDTGHILVAIGSRVLAGDTDGVKPLCTAPFDVNAVASFGGRQFVSSKVAGLCIVEDGAVQKLRPSIRAHHLETTRGLLVAAGSLSMATTDDGFEFLTRDLQPFVRIANQRMPLFLQSEHSEDPAV